MQRFVFVDGFFGGEWLLVPPTRGQPPPRALHSAAVLSSASSKCSQPFLMLYGGEQPDLRGSHELFVFSQRSAQWHHLPTPVRSPPRTLAQSAVLDPASLIVFGGRAQAGLNHTVYNQLWALSTAPVCDCSTPKEAAGGNDNTVCVCVCVRMPGCCSSCRCVCRRSLLLASPSPSC